MYVFIIVLCVVDAVFGVLFELNDETFSTAINFYDYLIVMFHSPLCDYCIQLKPEFELAAGALRSNHPPVYIATVDCTGDGNLTCDQQSISGFPTLNIFRKGKFLKEYDGPIEKDGIIEYMSIQARPSPEEISTSEMFDEFVDSEDLRIVGFFNKDGFDELMQTFLDIADDLRHTFNFGLLKSSDLASEKGIPPGITLVRPRHLRNILEPISLTYGGLNYKSHIELWLKANRHSLVDHRTLENRHEFQVPLVVAYYNVDFAKNPKTTNYWRNRIMKVAKNFVDDFNFAVSSKNDFLKELDLFGYVHDYSEKPIVCALSKDHKKYRMKNEFSVKNFELFLIKLKHNQLIPYLRSEPDPNNEGKYVLSAVGNNFLQVVNDNNKDAFINFYAPWCGFSQQLSQMWEELGYIMAEENVTIVQMDATNNDPPSYYKIRGFPTIYWVSKDSKTSPVVYEGNRTVNDFVKYIAKEASSELNYFDRTGNPKSIHRKDEL